MDDCVLASAARTTDSCDGLGPSSGEGMFTGKVGTALYLSPEMMRGESKTRYDQVNLIAFLYCMVVFGMYSLCI